MNARLIETFDDVVAENLAEEVVKVVHNFGFHYGWKSSTQISLSHWNEPLSRTGTPSNNRKDIRRESDIFAQATTR